MSRLGASPYDIYVENAYHTHSPLAVWLLQIKRIGAIQEALAKQLLDKAAYERLPPLQASDDDD